MLHDTLALLNCSHIVNLWTFQVSQDDYPSVLGYALGTFWVCVAVHWGAPLWTRPRYYHLLLTGTPPLLSNAPEIQGPEDASVCSWKQKLASVAICDTSLLLTLFLLSHEGWVKKHENVTVILISLGANQKKKAFPKEKNKTSWKFAKYKSLKDKDFSREH